MKTSTTTQLQLEKLDRVALDNLREALPHYTKLTDIAVSGTPLTNQDAIVYIVLYRLLVVRVCSVGLGVSVPILGFRLVCCFHFRLRFPLPCIRFACVFAFGSEKQFAVVSFAVLLLLLLLLLLLSWWWWW